MEGYKLTIGDEDAPQGAISEIVPEEVPRHQEEGVPTAEELFAAHVADVYDHGDAIDKLKSLRFRSALMRTAVPSVAIMEGGLAATATYGMVSGVVATAAVLGYSRVKGNKDRKQAEHQFALDTQDAIGEAYELYKPKKQIGKEQEPVELVWYGPASTDADDIAVEDLRNTTYREHLIRMAAMAKGQGIQSMHVQGDALRMLEYEANRLSGARADNSISEVIKRTKHFKAEFAGYQAIATKTPDEWLALAENFAPQSKGETLDQFKSLAALHPTHHLSKIVEDFQEDPELMVEKLRKKAAALIDERMVRYDTATNPAFSAAIKDTTAPIVKKGQAPDEDAKKQDAQHSREYNDNQEPLPNPYFTKGVTEIQNGTVRGGSMVAWRTPYGKELQSLDDATGLDGVALTQLLKNRDLDPHKADKALELAFYKLAHGKKVDIPEAVVATEDDEPPIVRTLVVPPMAQEYLVSRTEKNTNFWPRRTRQILAGVALAATVIAGGKSAYDGVEGFGDARVASIKADMARKQGVHLADISSSDARKRAEATYPDLWVWDKAKGTERFLSSFVPEIKLSKHNDDPSKARPNSWSTYNTDDSYVSNGGGDHTSAFDIQSHDGMETGGYWASSTASTLDLKRTQREKLLINWQSNSDMLSTSPIPEKLPKSYQDGEWLKVHRWLGQDEVTPLASSGMYYKYNIPVLEGTKPVAATMDGKAVDLVEKKDHTYMLMTTSEDVQKLDYWLVPDKGNKPVFQKPLGIIDDHHRELTGDEWFKQNNDYLVKKMKQEGQIDQKLQGQAAVDAVANAIKNNWKYDLSPIDDEKADKVKEYTEFIDMATGAKTADCEVSNTLMAVANYDRGAPVMGFYNGFGDGNDKLTNDEGHMWRTDGDATPSDTTHESSKSNSSTGYETVRDVAIGAAETGLGGLALGLGYGVGLAAAPAWYRRRMRKHFENATAAAEVVSYAESFTAEAYEQRKLDRAPLQSDFAKGLEMVFRPHLYSNDVVARLQEEVAKRSEDDPLANELRQGIKSIESAHNTAATQARLNEFTDKIRRLRGKRPLGA